MILGQMGVSLKQKNTCVGVSLVSLLFAFVCVWVCVCVFVGGVAGSQEVSQIDARLAM